MNQNDLLNYTIALKRKAQANPKWRLPLQWALDTLANSKKITYQTEATSAHAHIITALEQHSGASVPYLIAYLSEARERECQRHDVAPVLSRLKRDGIVHNRNGRWYLNVKAGSDLI